MKKRSKFFSYTLSTLITMTALNGYTTISTVQIMASSASPQCADYKVVGICYWLFCTPFGCKIRTSTKVRHFLPEQVVSGYNHGGQNPWSEVRSLGNGIKGGSYQDKPATKQYSQMVFKNVDVIGHPQGAISQFLGNTGYYCRSQSYAFQPHFLSGMDVMGWHHGVPEMFYPEAIILGMREMGKNGDMWGNIYPRTGSVTQIHPYKAAAVAVQRAADIISRQGQPHIYIPAASQAQPQNGWWPPPPVEEGKIRTHKWQMLSPKTENMCAIFPDGSAFNTYSDKNSTQQDFAWALWRPYSCCKPRGKYLYSIDWIQE
ncbi:TIGR03756 family integrating conjugative element protein [Pasteurella multocida]|uniref:TIGR03756 family integrating conjugative element protein n=1 Tax=Pasteurella multocida TaxID=747 RepID=UPI003977F38A